MKDTNKTFDMLPEHIRAKMKANQDAARLKNKVCDHIWKEHEDSWSNATLRSTKCKKTMSGD